MLTKFEGWMHVGRHDGSDSDDKVACRRRRWELETPENFILQLLKLRIAFMVIRMAPLPDKQFFYREANFDVSTLLLLL